MIQRENTFLFSIELRVIIEFFRSLPLENLKQIKRIYLLDRLQPYIEGSIDIPLLSSATIFLGQRMSLNSFSIAVPQRIKIKIDRSSLYPYLNHRQLLSTALGILQDSYLKEIQFIQKRAVNLYLQEGEVSIFGNNIIKDFIKYILLDKEIYLEL